MGPLEGIKVLELGQVVAAPFCGAILADFGAEVIKLEVPGLGDGLRKMGPMIDGRSPWFEVENRNKKCITLNLKTDKGKEILVELIKQVDVITENFKPGILEKLGFSWEKIHALNKKAILIRISGYGQTGPYKNRYGYDRIGLGMGGLTYITGEKESAPLRPGVSLADYLTGYAAAQGALMALYHRDIKGSGEGQEIELGLYETVFRIMEFTALNYSVTGAVRERIGNAFPGTVPSGHFQTKDNKWISLAVGNEKLFVSFAKVVGREDLLSRPEYATHAQRALNRTEIDNIAAEWIARHTEAECFQILGDHVPIGPIHSIENIFSDPHYAFRNNLVEVDDKAWGKVKVQNVVPNMSGTPGEVKWLGPKIGEHNAEVYNKFLGLSAQEVEELAKEKII